MKRCPTCQQTFPDHAPDLCPYDGTPVINDAPQEYQQYYAGGQPPPYGTPGGAPQWQPPPPGGGYYQQPGQYPPYPPPYGGPYAPRPGAGGLSKAALFTGIGALGGFIIAVLFAVIAINSRNRDLLPVVGIFGLLSLLAGLTAVVLGIVTLTMANRNPMMNKVHGILGIVFGAIPIILWFLGLANGRRW
jgi:hypothetical protein